MLDNKTILILLAILVLFYFRIQKERFEITQRQIQFCNQFTGLDYSSCYNNGCTVFIGNNGSPFCYPRSSTSP